MRETALDTYRFAMPDEVASNPGGRQRLTRRANHLQMFNIAKILSPRRETGRGFLNRTAAAFRRTNHRALLAFFLLSSAGASAGDYSVTYAIDANGKNDAGKIETCNYDKPCEIEPVGLGLSIFLSFIRPDHRSVQLHVYSRCTGYARSMRMTTKSQRRSLTSIA
jgi:hypothetical protein